MRIKKKSRSNPVAKELRTPKYQAKKIPNKKRKIINKKYKYEECI